jgi:hypothetical protein
MVRRSENSFAAKKRRLPHRATVKRAEPFLAADNEEFEAACRRIAGNTEYLVWSGTSDDERQRWVRLIAFETAEKAAALQAWIDESRIAERPLPRFGPSKEEIATLREEALRWGFATGAARRVVQAYRRKMFEDGNESEAAKYWASHTVAMYRPPGHATIDVAIFLVEWAKTNHPDWFYRRRRDLAPPAKTE